MTELLNDSIVKQLEDFFGQLTGEVKIFLFTSRDKQEACETTSQLLFEVSSLSPKISMIVVDSDAKPSLASQYQVEGKAPALVITALDKTADGSEQITDYGIRLLGVPAGHEFGTLIQDILLVSVRKSGLSDELRAYVQGLSEPLHLEVFATPG